MIIETIIEISGSVTLSVAIASLIWICKFKYEYTLKQKILAGLIIAYSVCHLIIHNAAPNDVSIWHVLLDDGFLIVITALNSLNRRDQQC